jgi:hypothetical protein
MSVLKVALILFGIGLWAAPALGCGVGQEEQCSYTCIEWYPNGKDCKKTRKDCVCVDKVHVSGDTPHVPPPNPKR